MNNRWTMVLQIACMFVLGACNNNGGGSDVTDVPTTTDTGGDVAMMDTVTSDAVDVVTTDTTPPTDTSTGTPLNGCTSFMDLSAATATRTITFAGTSYTPNCVSIAAGQSVMFSGDFTVHPLMPGQAPSRPATDSPSTTPTPISATTAGTMASFTFATAGNYGFYCAVHQSLGMYGVIRVQ